MQASSNPTKPKSVFNFLKSLCICRSVDAVIDPSENNSSKNILSKEVKTKLINLSKNPENKDPLYDNNKNFHKIYSQEDVDFQIKLFQTAYIAKEIEIEKELENVSLNKEQKALKYLYNLRESRLQITHDTQFNLLKQRTNQEINELKKENQEMKLQLYTTQESLNCSLFVSMTAQQDLKEAHEKIKKLEQRRMW
jgi:hypothetical protein